MTDTEAQPSPQKQQELLDVNAVRNDVDQDLRELRRDPSRVKNVIVRSLKGKQERVNTAISEGKVDRNSLSDANTLLEDLKNEHVPESVRRVMQERIKDRQAKDFEAVQISRDEIPTSLGDVLSYFREIRKTYQEQISDHPVGSREWEAMRTARNFAQDMIELLQGSAVNQVELLEERLINLRQLRGSNVFGEREYRRLKAGIETAIVDVLETAHTTAGRVDEQAFSQELYDRARNWDIDADVGDERVQKAYEDRHREKVAKLDEETRQKMRQEMERARQEAGSRGIYSDEFGYGSSYQLEEEEFKILFGPHPEDLIEKHLRDYERGRLVNSDKLVQQAEARLGLVITYISMPKFEKIWNGEFEEREGKKVPGSPLRDKMTTIQFREKMREKIRSRQKLQDFRNILQGADFKAILPVSGTCGSGGWFNSITQNNAHIAFNRLEQKIEQLRLQTDTQNPFYIENIRLRPRYIEELRDQVKAELKAEMELHGFKDEAEIEAAVNIGYNLLVTSQRLALHVSWGKSPAVELLEKSAHSFLPDPDDYMAGLFNILDFNIDKWYMLTEPQQRILSEMFKWIGGGDIQTGRRRFADSIQMYDVHSSGWRVKTAVDKLREIYEFEYGQKEGYEIFKTLALGMKLKQAGKDYRWQDRTDTKEMKKKRAALVHAWQQVAKYRPQEIAKIFAEMVNYEMVKDKDTGGERYRMKDDKKRDPTGELGLQIRVIDKKRPNIMAQIFEQDALGLRGYVQDERGKHALTKITNYAELEQFIGRYFYPIQELLNRKVGAARGKDGRTADDEKGLPAINYSLGIEGLQEEAVRNPIVQAQLDRVNKVFRQLGGEQWQEVRDEYFKTMQKLTDFGTGKTLVHVIGAKHTRAGSLSVIDELIENIEYEWLYRNNARWLDDVRFAELQEQDLRETGIAPMASEYYMGQGVGARDMMQRAWGDMNQASEAFNSMYAAMITLDDKELISNLQKAWNAIKVIEGPTEGAQAIAAIAGSWINMAKTNRLLGFFGLDKLPIAASKWQKYMGQTAPALGSEERGFIKETLQRLNLQDFLHDPEFKKRFERVAAVTNFEIWFNRHKTFILLVLVLLLQKTLEEAQKQE